jgi:hypothetical protein
LEDPGIEERIILKWIFKSWDAGLGLDRYGSGYGEVVYCYECGSLTLVS